MSAAQPLDIEAIRHALSRATGTGWEAAYRQDVGALLDEVERLRAYVGDLKRHGASLHKAAAAGRDAERAAVVALLRKAAADHETELKAPMRAEGMAWLRGGCSAIYDALDTIERGEHRREEEK
jgi:hypothetical protein